MSLRLELRRSFLDRNHWATWKPEFVRLVSGMPIREVAEFLLLVESHLPQLVSIVRPYNINIDPPVQERLYYCLGISTRTGIDRRESYYYGHDQGYTDPDGWCQVLVWLKSPRLARLFEFCFTMWAASDEYNLTIVLGGEGWHPEWYLRMQPDTLCAVYVSTSRDRPAGPKAPTGPLHRMRPAPVGSSPVKWSTAYEGAGHEGPATLPTPGPTFVGDSLDQIELWKHSVPMPESCVNMPLWQHHYVMTSDGLRGIYGYDPTTSRLLLSEADAVAHYTRRIGGWLWCFDSCRQTFKLWLLQWCQSMLTRSWMRALKMGRLSMPIAEQARRMQAHRSLVRAFFDRQLSCVHPYLRICLICGYWGGYELHAVWRGSQRATYYNCVGAGGAPLVRGQQFKTEQVSGSVSDAARWAVPGLEGHGEGGGEGVSNGGVPVEAGQVGPVDEAARATSKRRLPPSVGVVSARVRAAAPASGSSVEKGYAASGTGHR